MRVTKEVKEVLFTKIKGYSSNVKEKYKEDSLSQIVNDLTTLYKKKEEEFKRKGAEEAIKEIEHTHAHKFQKEQLKDIIKNLINGYSWNMETYCASKEQEAKRDKRKQIEDLVTKEKQDLILKLPFLKKEEELKEYMKGIEDRLNAI